jgi:antitoxin component of MazEF toxin-antitoxin module
LPVTLRANRRQQLGSAVAVRIPSSIAKSAGFKADQSVEVSVGDRLGCAGVGGREPSDAQTFETVTRLKKPRSCFFAFSSAIGNNFYSS